MAECPVEIEAALLKILSLALVNIRGFGMTEPDAARCAAEADHVHNLPSLIGSYSAGALGYYLDVCVPEYVRLVGQNSGTAKLFQPLWEKLREYQQKQNNTPRT